MSRRGCSQTFVFFHAYPFVGDEIRGLDSDGGAESPFGGYVYEISIWSNTADGETVTFKYFDDVHHVIIDLNETYDFVVNDTIGDLYAPFTLTGNLLSCDCEGNYFDDCGECGGIGTDVDNDSICDDIDECIGEYDTCGVCEGFGFDDTFYNDINWNDDVNTGAEFSATLANAIVIIDGQARETGKLAAFAGGEVIGTDITGGVLFPPTGDYIWEASLYSDDISAGTISFKYFDDIHHIIIDLDQTVEWEVNAIYGESAISPFVLTGNLLTCDCNGNYFDDCGECDGDGAW